LLAAQPKLQNQFLCGLFHTTSIPTYCIPSGVKMQKMSIIANFYPQNTPNMGVNRHFPAKRA